MPDALRSLIRNFGRVVNKALVVGWYVLLPVSFFKLVHGVFVHWKGGTFSGDDVFVAIMLSIMVFLAYRYVGVPFGGSLLAIAYIAYSLA
ncbi:hypothetical protein [Thermus scotoductus]|uniref:Uncharacterized protein n=2 Tax=Thermus scotoductus TaxID=37636 RepID=A0A430R7Z7_THESC|nr:hypothetical protein [Thermus scotoductus]RTG96659.1 hypothetical protein CSW49_04315 [Thermus scotoductus]RTH03519.1 hypothetical protein CSW45_06535 [Thermus scotoductus]RTH16061.1 hypothetical protein CSW42_13760 [Thermus scotoductus]RTH97251.1 hypothetical protein CSW28_11270 [Thermus scotoductus]RTI03892.1 hypothetical protein CSW30_14260 [Thermus scotoductus]